MKAACAAVLLLAVAASAAPAPAPAAAPAAQPSALDALIERLKRDYIQPTLDNIAGALHGKEPTLPAPPLPSTPASAAGTAAAAQMVASVMNSMGGFANSAAASLASPDPNAPVPAAPASPLPVPPAAAGASNALSRTVQDQILSKIDITGYASDAARSLGSADQNAGPPEPDLSSLLNQGGAGPSPASGGANSSRKIKPRPSLLKPL